jgi:hypothetical protein
VNHEDFELSFRYNFLAPPVDNLPVEVQGPYMEEIEEKVRLYYQIKIFFFVNLVIFELNLYLFRHMEVIAAECGMPCRRQRACGTWVSPG